MLKNWNDPSGPMLATTGALPRTPGTIRLTRGTAGAPGIRFTRPRTETPVEGVVLTGAGGVATGVAPATAMGLNTGAAGTEGTGLVSVVGAPAGGADRSGVFRTGGPAFSRAFTAFFTWSSIYVIVSEPHPVRRSRMMPSASIVM